MYIYGFEITDLSSELLLLKYFDNGLSFCISFTEKEIQNEITYEDIVKKIEYIKISNPASIFSGRRFKYRHMTGKELVDMNPKGIKFKVKI